MKLPFLHQEVEVVTNLRESNDILDNPDVLHDRITEDGYLLIRGLTRQRDSAGCTPSNSGEVGSERDAHTRYAADGWYLQPRLSGTYVNGVNGQ